MNNKLRSFFVFLYFSLSLSNQFCESSYFFVFISYYKYR